MGRIAAGRDRAVESLSRLFVLLQVHVKFAKFFVVSRRGVVQNLCFEHLNAGPSAKPLKNIAKQRDVRQHFRNNVGAGAEEATQKNDIEPVVLRTPPYEMHDGE